MRRSLMSIADLCFFFHGVLLLFFALVATHVVLRQVSIRTLREL
jgi:hypothetical protein